jgi:hypothetical protein
VRKSTFGTRISRVVRTPPAAARTASG